MLKRTISAVVGIALAIGILLLAGTPVFSFAVSFVAVTIVYEIFKACGCIKYKYHSAVCLVFAFAMPILADWQTFTGDRDANKGVGGLTTERYFFALICVFLLFAGFIAFHKDMTFDKLCIMISSSSLVALSISCIVALKNSSEVHGVCYVILCLAGAWISDSGAYFVGTFFGKHKLCPVISPKKTVEGAVGGLMIECIVFVIYSYIYQLYQKSAGNVFEVNYLYIVIIAAISGGLGLIGDLSASLLKRQFGIKDFGSIMPGHGGMTDRFDSVLFVAPFMAFSLTAVNIFT